MTRHFARHRHVVVPNAAHNASFSGCVPGLIAKFLADGHGDGLDWLAPSRVAGRRLSKAPRGAQP